MDCAKQAAWLREWVAYKSGRASVSDKEVLDFLNKNAMTADEVLKLAEEQSKKSQRAVETVIRDTKNIKRRLEKLGL